MSPDARENLASKQAELACALAAGGELPSGFDATRIQAASRALANKRRQAVARAWPALAEALGEDFAAQFQVYAAAHPLPARGGPVADGRRFVRHLPAREWSPTLQLEVLSVDLRYKETTKGLVLRRGPALRAALLHDPCRLVLVLRLPWLGERWLRIPLGFRRRSAPCREVAQKEQ